MEKHFSFTSRHGQGRFTCRRAGCLPCRAPSILPARPPRRIARTSPYCRRSVRFRGISRQRESVRQRSNCVPGCEEFSGTRSQTAGSCHFCSEPERRLSIALRAYFIKGLRRHFCSSLTPKGSSTAGVLGHDALVDMLFESMGGFDPLNVRCFFGGCKRAINCMFAGGEAVVLRSDLANFFFGLLVKMRIVKCLGVLVVFRR